MVIAVNTKYLLKAYQQDYLKFIYECFGRIANEHPLHTFVFISDIAFDPSFSLPGNSILVVTSTFNRTILSGILYKIKMLSILKKYKANVFLDTDGLCSLFTNASLCLMVYHPHCLSNKDFIKKNKVFLYKNFIPLFLKRAKVIVTGSEFSKKYIIQQYKTGEQKIDVIYNAIPDFANLMEWEKEKVKAQYSDGNEYFIFNGDTSQQNSLLNLLKAFSHFKKWQKSGMQLLIIEREKLPKNFTESLKSFKYRKDVKLLNNLPGNEITKLFASAYCIIYYPLCGGFETSPLKEMKYNIPLITGDVGSMSEICADAALYVNFHDPADIAEKLMLVFKDEKLRNALIENGKQQVQKYNWAKSSDLLWLGIFILISRKGLLLLPVKAVAILSTTSSPFSTSPNTV